MGVRAYLLVTVADDMEQQRFISALKDLEEMPGVDFVDPVIGKADMLIMVDAPVTVEEVAGKIRSQKWVKNLEVLRIISMFERHRDSKPKLAKAAPPTGA